MEFEFRSDDDYRASRVINALSEQILAETTLFSFERSRKRLERTVIRAAQNAPASAVVEQSVNRFLKHSFFVADDNFRRAQLDQFFQTIVAVDHAAIKVVQIRSRKAPAVERNKRAKLRRNDRNDIQNHPFRLVARTHKRVGNLQTLGIF